MIKEMLDVAEEEELEENEAYDVDGDDINEENTVLIVKGREVEDDDDGRDKNKRKNDKKRCWMLQRGKRRKRRVGC